MTRCPVCDGDGHINNPVLWVGIGGGEYYECEYCNGRGVLADD